MAKSDIHWTICAFCQNETSEKLQIPQRNQRDIGGEAAYKSISEILIFFRDTQRSDDDFLDYYETFISENSTADTVCNILQQNKAVWHKCCRLYFVSKYNKLRSRNKEDIESGEPPLKKNKLTRSKLNTEHPVDADKCFICSQPQTSRNEKLHSVMTQKVTNRITAYAKKLEDSALIAKLSSGDLVAQGAKYHLSCYTNLKNSYRALVNSQSPSSKHSDKIHSLLLAQLVDFMIQEHIHSDKVKVFKQSELGQMYRSRLRELGVESNITNHWLKVKLLEQCPELHDYQVGK